MKLEMKLYGSFNGGVLLFEARDSSLRMRSQGESSVIMTCHAWCVETDKRVFLACCDGPCRGNKPLQNAKCNKPLQNVVSKGSIQEWWRIKRENRIVKHRAIFRTVQYLLFDSLLRHKARIDKIER